MIVITWSWTFLVNSCSLSLSLSLSLFEYTATPTSMTSAVSCIKKWQELGHQLSIDPGKLSDLFKSGRSGAECRDEMMTHWESHNKDASWEKLARALKRMGEYQLADSILHEHGVHVPVVAPSRPPVTNQESTTCMFISDLFWGRGGWDFSLLPPPLRKLP